MLHWCLAEHAAAVFEWTGCLCTKASAVRAPTAAGHAVCSSLGSSVGVALPSTHAGGRMKGLHRRFIVIGRSRAWYPRRAWGAHRQRRCQQRRQASLRAQAWLCSMARDRSGMCLISLPETAAQAVRLPCASRVSETLLLVMPNRGAAVHRIAMKHLFWPQDTSTGRVMKRGINLSRDPVASVLAKPPAQQPSGGYHS